MQAILNRLIEKIVTASIDASPSENIYMENVFDPAVYSEILAKLPMDSIYDFIQHPDAVTPDGRVTRKLLDLTDETINRMQKENQDFWHQMKEVFTSDALLKVITQKFSKRIQARFGDQWPDMVIVPIFYRDFPGYRISVHTDAPSKIATMQFYFPKDNSQIHLGTSFHKREGNQFPLLKTNKFQPNSAYAFVRTDNSWHSVKELGQHESRRDTLALTIYQKGQEYKSKTYL